MNQHEPNASDHSQNAKAAPKCPFARNAGTPVASLADTLKESTKEAHARAERHEVQAKMVKGKITRQEYGAWLGQMLPLWSAVDAQLSALAVRDARVCSMVKPYHAHADRVAADLKFLGQRASDHPELGATTQFVKFINSAAASGLPGIVGVWYVLEGSANGGRFIAKALSRGLGIAGPDGLTSFDPHGERQREYWQAWRADLDAHSFTSAERDAIIHAASNTFTAIYDIMQDMSAAKSHA